MSKITRWSIALLGLLALALVLVDWNLTDTDTISTLTSVNADEPTYQSEYTTTLSYNSAGRLHYKLVADHVAHFSEQQITWFTKPIATTFDDSIMPTWTVKADQAKLIQEKILYLYGHVQVDSLTDAVQLKRITTDNAVVNLITQDILSDNKVILHGTGFHSTGMKMRANLRNKTAELTEKVQTSYAIQNATP
ncbi:LPS export ABC transporter periplasmic protein LptC [Candidatus Doolittlea endobia]|uniref:Lipopolysaccharide export system protein LptC n=1 Tax=Candidatus Doolittlea endobia TaxID=1778262 RepID=A0A143WRM3_9ENTR|nr:LPS export ABC transporter periplasmic protein LptC [Candidatus Doolittlea endobia]CUX96382.1 Lipopolysaccharide export system protein LptC [Candidatus Doolittlea endobia]